MTRKTTVLDARGQKRKRKRKSKKNKAKKKAKKSSGSHAAEKESEKKGFSYYLRTFRLFLRIFKRIEDKLCRSFKITVLEMKASVATGDAASTAILYGVISQGFSYALALADNFIKTKYSNKNIYVVPDYTGTDSVFRIKIKLSSSLFHLIGTGISAAFAYLKERNNTKNKTQSEDQKNG